MTLLMLVYTGRNLIRRFMFHVVTWLERGA